MSQTRKALDKWISQEKIEKKKIKMLEGHEYDPDCFYCSNNKFVKDAHAAKESLETTTHKIIHLQQLMRDLSDDIALLDPAKVQADIDLHVKLQEDIHKTKRTIEMNRLSIEGNKSKINLMQKEHEELCAKKLLYEENKEAIENLETLKREQAYCP